MRALAYIVSTLLLAVPAFAQERIVPEDIPLWRLAQTIPAATTMQEAQASMGTALAMRTVPTIRRAPEPGTWEPFCQTADCVEIPVVATYEPKVSGASLVACDTVRAGLAIAVQAWAEFETGTATLKEMTAELETTPLGTPRHGELLTQINALIMRLNQLTTKIRSAYPSSFNQIDRKVVFQWTVIPSKYLQGWPRIWVAQGLQLDLQEAYVRGYTWKKGQGEITDLGGMDGLPTATGRTLRFALDATPVQICSEGRDVRLAGHLTLEFGIYDAALTAWRTNARTNLTVEFKGTPP